MQTIWPIATILAFSLCMIVFFGWRWASRQWQLPCPSLFGWALESQLYHRVSGTATTLNRMELRPGQQVLEFGPGPGRLLIPAAQRVWPRGSALGIDIQPGMIRRLEQRAAEAGASNLTAIAGDATQTHVAEATFDLVFMVTTLGEIPNRQAALLESHKAIKPGGILSITEIFGDPHYQSQSKVRRLAETAGFELHSIQGRWWFYTANFVKP